MIDELVLRLGELVTHSNPRYRILTRALVLFLIAYTLLLTYVLGDVTLGLPTPDDLTDSPDPTPAAPAPL